MEREFIVRRTQTKLHEAEAATEETIAKLGVLLADVYEAKKELGLAGTVAAEETARIARAVALVQEAHGELVATHHGLGAIARLLKIPVKMIGWKPGTSAQAPAKIAAA